MDTKFDVNRGLENPKTRKFIRTIIAAIVIVALSAFIFLSFNSKHNKIGNIETNIPATIVDTFRRDTPIIINNNNQKTEINIKENNGDINLNK